MTPLWTAAAAAAATGGQFPANWQATGVSIDTRTLAKGDLFVALKDIRDGHDFVALALEKGAAAALVSRIPEGVAADAPLLLVPDVQAALEQLGAAARARTGARVVAVTGSVGKTSTKEMLRTAFTGQARLHAAEASYNNHWGVPLTLARMPIDTEIAIIEIGMNHPGEIAPLSRLARPHIALITTVAPAHLEAFADLNAIATEKASIVAGLEPGGTAILPADLWVTPVLTAAASLAGVTSILYGSHAQADYRLTGVQTTRQAFCRQCPCRAGNRRCVGVRSDADGHGAWALVPAHRSRHTRDHPARPGRKPVFRTDRRCLQRQPRFCRGSA